MVDKNARSMMNKRVKYVDEESHLAEPWFYPPVGHKGTVVEVSDDERDELRVKWDKGSGTDFGECWWAESKFLELAEDESKENKHEEANNNLTDEEIWNMLEPKMTKNGFTTKMAYIRMMPTHLPEEDPIIKTYDENIVHKMVSLAYKVGYMRCRKGKPFAYKRKENVKNEG